MFCIVMFGFLAFIYYNSNNMLYPREDKENKRLMYSVSSDFIYEHFWFPASLCRHARLTCYSVAQSCWWWCGDSVMKLRTRPPTYHWIAPLCLPPSAATVTTHSLQIILAFTSTRCNMRWSESVYNLSLIHISEPTRLLSISYAVFCLKKKS